MAVTTWIAQFGPGVASGDLVAWKGAAPEWFQVPNGGDVTVTDLLGDASALTGLPAGAVYPGRFKAITATGGCLAGNGAAPGAPPVLMPPPQLVAAGPALIAPGPVLSPGSGPGDRVLSVYDVTLGVDASADFEPIVTVPGQIQQTGIAIVGVGDALLILSLKG
jgi:hypothetical protein